jgi:hypothetical protein
VVSSGNAPLQAAVILIFFMSVVKNIVYKSEKECLIRWRNA